MTVALDNDTKQGVRMQDGGLYAVDDAAASPGRIFWVGSNVTGATNGTEYGQNPATPFATLVYAETMCLSGRGDTIYILPGHSETLASATGAAVLTLDVANLTIIGLGRSTRPAFLIDGHANNYVAITGADTTLVNLCFKSGHANVAQGLNVAADGVTIRGCVFVDNTTNENFVTCINDGEANTADGLLVEDCGFFQANAAGTYAIELGAAQDRVVIRNNVAFGLWEDTAIGGAGVPTNILIENNYIQNRDDEADSCITLPDLSTGCVVRNLVHAAVAGNATTNIYVGTKMMLCENYSVDAAGDVQGVLDPVAT